MTKKEKRSFKENKELIAFFNFLILAILAFATAFCFRRSAGVLAMTPIAFLLCAVSAFIKYDLITKIVMFGVAVFILNTVESDNMLSTIAFTALCLLAVLFFNHGIPALKKNRKKGISIIAIGAVVCIALSLVFVGNPIKGIKSKALLNEYVEANYPQSDNSVLGKFDSSNVYYNFDTRAYSVDIVSEKFPTEGARISVNGDAVTDDLYSLMEAKVGEQYIVEMSAILREHFPDGSFEVLFDGFASLPDQKLLLSEKGELYQNVYYEIYIGGVQSAEAMRESVELYIDAIDKSGIDYAKITFKSGIGTWMVRSVTVDPNHPFYHDESVVNYVSIFLSNRFSDYLITTFIEY